MIPGLAFFLMLSFSMATFATKGVVVYNKSDCDYYIVETNMGYVLLEWYGGNDPGEGAALVGDYESYGMKTVYNLFAEAEARVWVEEYWMSKDDVIEEYYNQCG